MTLRADDVPALAQFMGCYWMENGDLVYGNLTGAVQAFLASERPGMRDRLLADLNAAQAAGLVLGDLPTSSSEEAFWGRLGARWLSPADVELIRLLLGR